MDQRFQSLLDFKARVILAPYSREMRISPTTSEALLWRAIRGSALGIRFRRQVVLGHFIVDFFAPSVSLVVEVDGPCHTERVERDRARDATFAARGLRVLRISALLVECNLTAAVEQIRGAIQALRGTDAAAISRSLPLRSGEAGRFGGDRRAAGSAASGGTHSARGRVFGKKAIAAKNEACFSGNS